VSDARLDESPALAGETADAVDAEEDLEDEADDWDDREEDEEEETERLPPQKLASMCSECPGHCCRYYTVYLDEPLDADDFDEFRWFLCHEGCYLYIDEEQWHLNIESRCRFLGPGNRCLIYEHRPDVCREFGWEDECEFTGEYDFEHTFRTLDELEAYAREVLPPKEFAKLKRSPKGWKGPV
jgi:Fe-S-cluster containining protein